jgi:hypothetical protein
MAVCESIAYAAPVGWFRRRQETIRAGGACSVRDSFEDLDPAVVEAANFSKGSFSDDVLGVLRI